MKLLLLIALFVYVQCRPELPPTDVLKQHYNEIMTKALKRKYGDSYTGNAEVDACTLACAKGPPPGFGQHIMKFQDPKPDQIIKEIYNKEFLTKVCTHANETAQCVKACPDSQRRAYLRQLFAPVKYLCADSHIVEKADCLRGAFEEYHPACASGECAAKKAAVQTSLAAYKAALGDTLHGPGDSATTKPLAEDLVGKGCEAIRCGVKCGDAKRTEKCGEAVNKEIHTFFEKLAHSLDDWRYLSPRDYVIDIPQSCHVEAH